MNSAWISKTLFTSLALALLTISIASQDVSASIVIWGNDAPNSNFMGMTATPDPFGTGHGDIGCVVTDGKNQFTNINSGNIDYTQYAGLTYTFSYDIYVDSSVPATDDTVYWNLFGGGGGWTLVNTHATDQWVTMSWTGVVQAGTFNTLLLNNHKGTTETTPSFYLDNISLSVPSAVPEPSSLAILGLVGGLVTLRRRK